MSSNVLWCAFIFSYAFLFIEFLFLKRLRWIYVWNVSCVTVFQTILRQIRIAIRFQLRWPLVQRSQNLVCFAPQIHSLVFAFHPCILLHHIHRFKFSCKVALKYSFFLWLARAFLPTAGPGFLEQSNLTKRFISRSMEVFKPLSCINWIMNVRLVRRKSVFYLGVRRSAV